MFLPFKRTLIAIKVEILINNRQKARVRWTYTVNAVFFNVWSIGDLGLLRHADVIFGKRGARLGDHRWMKTCLFTSSQCDPCLRHEICMKSGRHVPGLFAGETDVTGDLGTSVFLILFGTCRRFSSRLTRWISFEVPWSLIVSFNKWFYKNYINNTSLLRPEHLLIYTYI